MITQEHYDALKQTVRTLYLKVEVLDDDLNVVGEITGNVTSGSISISSTSTTRRTFNVDMVITDSSLDLQPGGKIWIYRPVRPSIGIENIQTGQIVWYDQGIGIVDNPSWKFDPNTSTLSFSALDMSCLLDGTYDGNITFEGSIVYSPGENVRKAIIDTIKQFVTNFSIKTLIQECTNIDGSIVNIPNEMTFEPGANVWQILEQFAEILPNYQIFFDTDGVLHYEPVPYVENPYISLDDDMWEYAVLSEDTSIALRDVYNSVTILGRAHDVTGYFGELSKSGSSYNASDYESMPTDGKLYSFKPLSSHSSNQGRIFLQVGTFPAVQIVDSNGKVPTLVANSYCVLQYNASQIYNGASAYVYLGGQQAMGSAKDENSESPFSIENLGKTKAILLSTGEYDNIPSDDLCQQRAEWEIYRRSRMYDTIKLSCIPIYFLDVNTVVEYTSKRTNEKAQYLVQSVSTDWSEDGTTSVTLQRYYPYYK